MSSGKTYSLSGLCASRAQKDNRSRDENGDVPPGIPSAFPGQGGIAGQFQLGPRPHDGLFRSMVEPIRVKQCALIVIAEQYHLALHDQINALARVGSVTDHISQTIDLVDLLFLDIFQHRLKGFKVAVNIADNGLHATALPGLAKPNKTGSPLSPAWTTGVLGAQNIIQSVYAVFRKTVKRSLPFKARNLQFFQKCRWLIPSLSDFCCVCR